LSQFPKRSKKQSRFLSCYTALIYFYSQSKERKKDKERATPHIHTKKREENRVPEMLKLRNNEFCLSIMKNHFEAVVLSSALFPHYNPSSPYSNLLQGKLRNWTQDPAIN
jgi:hypothetical protein